MYRFLTVLVIAAGSAAVLIGLFLAYYLTGERYGAKAALNLWEDSLALVAGRGGVTARGLEIRQVSAQGAAFASSDALNLPAGQFPALVWHIDGIRDGTDVRFVWATSDAPATMHEVPLQATDSGSGRIDLRDQPQWRDVIAGVGIMVYGELAQPVTIRRLQFRQAGPGAAELLEQLWSEWTTSAGWSQRSVNFVFGAPHQALFHPVPFIAAWVGLSALGYGGWLLVRRRRWVWTPFAVLFVTGWLLLDARWQWDLWQRLQTTQHQFAGKSWHEKRLAGEDGPFYRFMREIKSWLPETPVRVLIVSADPGEGTRYLRSRAQYHLLPHNVYSALSRPTDRARAGDYLLILQPIQGLHYQAGEQMLHWDGKALAVEPIHVAEPGVLFRIRED